MPTKRRKPGRCCAVPYCAHLDRWFRQSTVWIAEQFVRNLNRPSVQQSKPLITEINGPDMHNAVLCTCTPNGPIPFLPSILFCPSPTSPTTQTLSWAPFFLVFWVQINGPPLDLKKYSTKLVAISIRFRVALFWILNLWSHLCLGKKGYGLIYFIFSIYVMK